MRNILKKIFVQESHEDFVTSEELQNLHSQLEKLLTFHKSTLQEAGVEDDAERIVSWIEHCQEGSLRAERKLYQEGVKILEDISKRLHLALEEQQRIEEESPAVASKTKGREIERFAKASYRANNALTSLNNLTQKPN